MKFGNEISVDAPADELFQFLADLEQVAPCLPGASIEGRDGDDYRGSMRVKVGPITGTYNGKMRFVELDHEARRAVMSARADEVAGQGNAEAWIEAQVSESDGRSQLQMSTDLQLRGRVAQFGRGSIEKIAERMFSEFAHNLEERIAGGGAEKPEKKPAQDQAVEGDAPKRRAEDQGQAEPAAASLDVIGVFGGPLVRKALPGLVPALIGFGYGYLLGRLRELRR